LALEAVPAPNPRYFFWSAAATEDNAGDPFWRWLDMLRDTFAVELLLAGVPTGPSEYLAGN
jgi:hypothetical protein